MAKNPISLFPTLIYSDDLPSRISGSLNKTLLKEIREFQAKDKLGRDWSKENYRGGFTSYASLCDMHHRAPGFMQLSEILTENAKKFAKSLHWQMDGLELRMTACWFNVMPAGVYHTLHNHPLSVLSGAYYVSIPSGSVGLRLEDPRMGLYMKSPMRDPKAPKEQQAYFSIDPKPGRWVMFESWLRHEVPPNQSKESRISISFNFDLELADCDGVEC